MNYLAKTIIENAAFWQEKWQKGECTAKSNNRGNCIDEIKAVFSKEVINTPWCAEFVSVVVRTACAKLAIKNLLPYTRSTATMLAGAKKAGLRVDSTPVVGSVFYRSRTGGGHVGIVAKITDGGIVTIEGNSNDAVLGRSYSGTEIAKWQFIHTEEMGEPGFVKYTFRDGIPTGLYITGGIGVAVGIYYWNKHKHFLPKELGINDEIRSSGTESTDQSGIVQSEGVS